MWPVMDLVGSSCVIRLGSWALDGRELLGWAEGWLPVV
jgi:hypothetical protein